MSMIIRTTRSHGPSLARHREASRADCAHRSAAHVIDQAHEEAARIVTQAEERATQLTSECEQALEQQRIESRNRLEEEINRELSAAQSLMTAVVGEMAKHREQSLGQLHIESLELAIAIAARILRRELQYNSQLVIELTREALAMVDSGNKLTVYVHPDDLLAFRQPLQRLLSDIQCSPEHLTVDAEMSRGGCRVETERGVIDQTVEMQLERIAEELLHVS